MNSEPASASKTEPEKISGLGEVADRFDCFLIDQFGVLRDGRGAYPGAAEALTRLKAAGKRVVILSNSGKRSAENSTRLAAFGFDEASWDRFLTSGETAWQILAEEEPTGDEGKRCLLISRDRDTSAIDGLKLTRVWTGDEADVVIISASEGDHHSLSYYERLLGPAARRGVPCLCTNPDKIMLTRSGETFGAGRIAELYQELGGTVRWIGKPFPDIYAAASRFLGAPDPARVACIGDSVEHDIAGAVRAGFASILVATGILASASDEERRGLYREHEAVPDFIMPQFLW
ncbi:MAG: TIGR01459 family HAD-type hydrolase [Shinella sp.]|nr:TIGR01459 family HAD-type hydrolase [Shinella sp.]